MKVESNNPNLSSFLPKPTVVIVIELKKQNNYTSLHFNNYVLNKKLTLSGIAFENAARRLIGKQDYFIDLNTPYKGMFQKVQEFFLGKE